jgi:hypothetical protein
MTTEPISVPGIVLTHESQSEVDEVEVNETEIVYHRPGGRIERVAFADLRAVIIETNDKGPFEEDVFWILFGARLESGCVYLQGATGAQHALAALQKLPGFDNEQLIRAMSSAHNARFLCWRAPGEPAFNADPPTSDRAG